MRGGTDGVLGEPPHRSWGRALRDAVRPPVLRMLFLGFSAGLPLLLIFSTLSVWLREAGVDRAAVTFFSWASLGYSFKFVWAPLVDRLPVPGLTRFLGRRRGWLLVAQLALAFAMLWTAAFDPVHHLALTGLGAVFIGFSAATQDICIDAYRIESAEADLQSMMSATYIAGYRVGMLVAGAGGLWLADVWGGADGYTYAAWAGVYRVMAGMMLVGILTTLVIPEPAMGGRTDSEFKATSDYVRFLVLFALAAVTFAGSFAYAPQVTNAVETAITPVFGGPLAGFLAGALRFAAAVAAAVVVGLVLVQAGLTRPGHVNETYVAPIADFLKRYGGLAVLVLALIGSYRIADVVMGAVANVFYVDLGFTKSQIAAYSKVWGLLSTIAGGFVGGVFALRFGVMKALFTGAVLAAASNVLFAGLAEVGKDVPFLIVAIVADNASAGLASAAFVAYLSSLTSVSFTAMQYALFSSLMTLFPKVLAGYSGTFVDAVGYAPFFLGTAALGLPVLALILLAARYAPPKAA